MANFESDLIDLFGDKMRRKDSFCVKIWSALANKIWRHEDGTEYACTFRYAGGLIAEIIGKGDYMDWYCSGPDAKVSKKIEKKMKSRNWTHHDYPED